MKIGPVNIITQKERHHNITSASIFLHVLTAEPSILAAKYNLEATSIILDEKLNVFWLYKLVLKVSTI